MNNTKEMSLSDALNDLNLSIDIAIEYLQETGYDIEPSLNTVIDNEIYNVLAHHFGKRNNLQDLFENSSNKVVAVKNWNKDDVIGFLRPIKFYENEFKTRGLNKEERETLFKNTGTIIVKREFYEIEEKFEEKEFFTFHYEEDRAFIPNSRISVQYCSLNADASSSKKLPLIITGNIHQILEDETLELSYSHHSFVFIRGEGKIYGPISIQQVLDREEDEFEFKENYKYTLQPLPIKHFKLDQNYENVIFEFNEDDITDYIIVNSYGKNDNVDSYISNVQHLVSNVKNTSFLLNEKEEDIIELVNRQIPEEYKDKKESWVSSFATDNEITRSRFKKYLALKNKSEQWVKFIEEYISSQYLTSSEGKEEIENYIRKHENQILGEHREIFDAKIKEDLKEETEELQKAREEKEKLDIEIEGLKNESQVIKSKSEELRNIEIKLSEAIEKLDLADNIKELKEGKDKQLELYVDTHNEVKKYEEMLKELQEQYSKESETSMRKKLIELQPYVSALNGFSVENTKMKINEINPVPFHQGENISLSSLLNEFEGFLQKNNRAVKTEDALNYLTNIQQNFLTIFSGLPGVGKTSLATHLSHFFTGENTFCSIPVSRGWNSRKNLLGYYNPISGSYQHDEYGFLDLLKWYSHHEEGKLVPAMILLDEANLSPMEHYWSDFISISDKDSQEKSISVGAEKVKIPQGLRFICTINSDHTTEILSPRLVDRSSVIKIPYAKPSDEGMDFFHQVQNFIPEKIYSQNELNKIFNQNTPELNRNEQKIFHEILSVLHEEKGDYGTPIFVSHRKIKLIYNYCHTTRDMYFDITGNQLLNLDFSILQHVLPLINGQGVKYENRLNTFKDLLEEKGFFRSLKELNSIITKGQDYKNFSFF